MKILRTTLSLEELEQLQSNAPDQSEPEDPQDPPAHDEVDSTGEEADDTADIEEQSEALEAQFLVLEDLYRSLSQSGKLTGKLLIQANEALPAQNLTHGHRSAEQRYSLAMEGVLSKAGELVKKMWRALAELWKKFCQHIMNPLDKLFGRNLDLLGITPAQATKRAEYVQAASSHLGEMKRLFPAIEDMVFEDRALKESYRETGGDQFPLAMNEMNKVVDRAPQVVVMAERYITEVRKWMATIKQGDPQPLPQDFEKGIETFTLAAKEFAKVQTKILHAEMANPIVTPQAIADIVHATSVKIEHGLPRRFFLTGSEGSKLVTEASKKIEAVIEAGTPEQVQQWRELHKELQVVLVAFRQVTMVFNDMAQAQKRAISLGDTYLRTIIRVIVKLEKNETTAMHSVKWSAQKEFIEVLLKNYHDVTKNY